MRACLGVFYVPVEDVVGIVSLVADRPAEGADVGLLQGREGLQDMDVRVDEFQVLHLLVEGCGG